MQLTAQEGRFVLRTRMIKMLWEAGFGIGSAALNIKLLRLADNNTALLAAAHATHWSLTSIGKVMISPVYGAASDALGRRMLWALGRFAMVIQFVAWWGCRSVRSFVIGHTIAWGVLPLDGSRQVEDAAWADVFGNRPDLSSKLQAQTQVWVSLAGLAAPILGAQIAMCSRSGAFIAGIAMSLMQCVLIIVGTETLPAAKRLKFNMEKTNPFKGLSLLFRNGTGLRRLAVAGALFSSVNAIYSTFDPYRLGPIGWSPAEQSYFSAALSGVNVVSTQLVSKPLFARLGSRRTFERTSLVAAFAYLGISQACRPAGAAAQVQRTIQFVFFKAILMTPWSEPARFAVLPLIVKQAQAVAPHLGRGEITAAQGALENLLQIVTPMLWAGAYRYFVRGNSQFSQLFGPGGHFVLAACFRGLSATILMTTRSEDLHVNAETPARTATKD